MNLSPVKRRLTCILVADAVGYSKQMGQDEEGTIQVLSAHRSVIDGIITFHEGRIVSTAGDSVLAEFSSAVDAVRCAVEIQEALKTRNDSLPEHRKMFFRVGVNLGDVVVKKEDLLGDGVNVAARLESIAEPGGICISSSVYDQITGRLDLGFQDIGEQTLKNISRPIRVYRVSGTVPPVRLTLPVSPAASAAGSRNLLPWAITAVAVLALCGVAAWQAGWVPSGSTGQAREGLPALPVAVLQPAPAAERSTSSSVAADTGAATLAQAEADAKRLRADADAIKQQAQFELARARADAQSGRIARAKLDADAAAVSASRFDGSWKVAVTCPKHEDGALGYTVDLVANVKDGMLRGEFGAEGKPGWLLLRGDINADGSATLDANGLTADPKLNVKNVRSGLPYSYQVAAHFDGMSGAGRRLQLRACVLTFAKQ